MSDPDRRAETPNEGEGNKSADRNYRESTRKFVESDRGKQEAAKAGNVTPNEEREIRKAEKQAAKRAKEHDPEEVHDPHRKS